MRFTGTVERLGPVEIAAPKTWITGIPFEAWPQQRRLSDGRVRPAMINDPGWHDFAVRTDALVSHLHGYLPHGLRGGLRMLSVLMPGHEILPHVDRQDRRWYARIHVPLTTDPASVFIVGGVAHHLDVGIAYLVNTEVEHSVSNLHGRVPRIHFMVDVGA